MKFVHTISGLLLVMLAACGTSGVAAGRPEVDVEIVNQSSRDLKNALVRFGEFECRWGSVGKALSAGYGFYPHPITQKAELHWDENGKHRTQKLDLSSVFKRGKSGRLTFTVSDDRVDVKFTEKS